jgi:hypothetical protein
MNVHFPKADSRRYFYTWIFLLCVLLIFIIAGIEWNLVLLLPLTILFSALVLAGTKIGFNFRDSDIIKCSGSDFSDSK